jgi:hypothetical protein
MSLEAVSLPDCYELDHICPLCGMGYLHEHRRASAWAQRCVVRMRFSQRAEMSLTGKE